MARQRKQVPSRTEPIGFWVDLVTHPEKNRSAYVSFEHANDAENKFKPNVTGFSRLNAWWLAEAAFLAYWRDPEKVKRIYEQQTGLKCEPLDEGGTQCHLAFNEDFAIVAFRGTQPDDWQDIFDDGRFGLDDWPHGRVHEGFKAAFKRIEKKLRDALKTHASNKPLWITGHSLGAALAVLAADTIETRGIYTFGLPRVGNTLFTGHYNQRFSGRSFRYVNDVDVVTHVPPGRPLTPYLHVDEQRWIDPDGNVSKSLPALQHFFSDIFGRPNVVLHILELLTKGQLLEMPDALADHAPVLYATHTWNDLVRNGP
jgi:triacylglycerol lipase